MDSIKGKVCVKASINVLTRDIELICRTKLGSHSSHSNHYAHQGELIYAFSNYSTSQIIIPCDIFCVVLYLYVQLFCWKCFYVYVYVSVEWSLNVTNFWFPFEFGWYFIFFLSIKCSVYSVSYSYMLCIYCVLFFVSEAQK